MLKNLFTLLIISTVIFSQNNFSFFQSGNYNKEIKTPEQFLEFAIGERPIRYTEAVTYLKYLAQTSDRLTIDWRYKTHQGRKLYYLTASSPENIKNISTIKNNITLLADPRKTNPAEADEIIKSTPLVAMMMYSIHGNELSGADASIQLAYQLAAGEDEQTLNLLNNLVTIIYPMENPDGRERFLSDVEQWKGKVPTDDIQSLPHRGTWPTGRTNHYHFDLNRDWFILSQPESRSRVSLMMEWLPQFVVDAHEMGSFSTFLMNPPREPINPYLNKKIEDWWKIFAKDQAETLDKYSWSYYTREWLEDWYPGYGSSYPAYFGAVSILYEQARTAGLNVKRPDGNILTYKESVQHQYVSSLANLSTSANNKNELMKTFYEIRSNSLKPSHPDGVEAFIFDNTVNNTRVDSLMSVLQLQGIEIYRAAEDFTLSGVRNYFEEESGSKNFSKGSYIIELAQPHQDIIKAVLDFDTRLKTSFLKTERESLLKENGSELYEVTAWSLPLSFAVNCYESYNVPDVKKEAVNFSIEKGELKNDTPAYGYLIKYDDDRVIKFLKDLLENDVKVRSAEKPFTVEGEKYSKGTLLIRVEENKSDVNELLDKLAAEHHVRIIGVNTALAQKGADLGGGEFELLYEPKIAFLVGQNTSMYNFGELWYLLDSRIGIKTSMLNLEYLGYHDLRKYNVIILPSAWGNLKDDFGNGANSKLKTWVKEGGTLITVGNSISVLADSSVGISNIKLRRKNLDQLNKYYEEVAEGIAASAVTIDSAQIWEADKPVLTDTEPVMNVDHKKEEEKDKGYIKFMPQGAILNAAVNEEHWLSNGVQSNVPVFYSSSYSFFALTPAEIAARLTEPKDVRLSGLLWPEAQHRLAYSSYLIRERIGKGQVISFADSPFFRAQYHGTARLFLNAVFLGPGYGANQVVEF